VCRCIFQVGFYAEGEELAGVAEGNLLLGEQ
jgi:hypothetical protein